MKFRIDRSGRRRWPRPAWPLLAADAGLGAGQGAVLPGAGRTAPAPTRPTACRWANGYVDYLKLINARRRHQRRQDQLSRNARPATPPTGRRVLRAPEGQDGGATVFQPLSTGITFALTEKAPGDKIPLITAGYGRSESQPTAASSSGTSRCSAPTGSAADILMQHIAKKEGGLRQAQGQEDRAGLPRQPVRQGADPAAAGARQDARLRAAAAAGDRTRASSRRPPGCRSARAARTTCCCGAGA